MVNIVTFFHKHVIAPIAGEPPEGAKTVSFIDHVRAASIAIACFMAFPPMVDGIVVYSTDDGSTASLVILIGCFVWLLSFALPYPIARFWLKRPEPVLCDVIAIGSLVSAVLWDIGSPTLIPLGLNSMFVAAFAGWCGTARGHVTVAIGTLFIGYQCYNNILMHGDLKDSRNFYRDLAAQCFALSNVTSPGHLHNSSKSCTGPLPEFKSRFPQHLFVRDYYFPAPIVDAMDSATFAFVVVLMYIAMRIQSAELVRQNDAANGAVRTVASIAEALRRYDTATTTKTLQEAQAPGRKTPVAPTSAPPVSEGRSRGNASAARYDARDSPKHSERTGTSIVERVTGRLTTTSTSSSGTPTLDEDLAEALAALVANLEAYRPYVPNWLLRSDTDKVESDAENGLMEEKLETEPSKESAALEYGSVGKSVETSPSMHSLSESGYSSTRNDYSSAMSRDTASTHHGVDHRHPPAAAMAAAKPTNGTTSRRALCAFALVTYDQTDTDDAATLAALVDAVHGAAMDTKGAVHSFALGEALVSWNCAVACANPETKAGLFASSLKSIFDGVVPIALHGLRCSVSIATGLARCETTGSVQRVVTAIAPVLHARLRGLAVFARETAASGGAFVAICDAATHAGASQHVVTAPAGIIDVAAHDPPKPIPVGGAELIEDHVPPRRRRLMLPPPRHSESAGPGPANAPTAVAAFEVIQPCAGDHADEWLYAMADGASDIAAKATIAAADLFAAHTTSPKPTSPRSPEFTLISVQSSPATVPAQAPIALAAAAPDASPSAAGCLSCHQQRLLLSVLPKASFQEDLQELLRRIDKARAASNGAELSQRPMWRAWRNAFEACTLPNAGHDQHNGATA